MFSVHVPSIRTVAEGREPAQPHGQRGPALEQPGRVPPSARREPEIGRFQHVPQPVRMRGQRVTLVQADHRVQNRHGHVREQFGVAGHPVESHHSRQLQTERQPHGGQQNGSVAAAAGRSQHQLVQPDRFEQFHVHHGLRPAVCRRVRPFVRGGSAALQKMTHISGRKLPANSSEREREGTYRLPEIRGQREFPGIRLT